MKSSKITLLFLALALTAAGCGLGGSGGSSGSPVTLVSIAVTPINPFVAPGTIEQFTATGAYSDNTTKDLTTAVTWSTSAPAVATISNEAGAQGLSTSIARGIAAITAVLGGVSGTTSLTVTTGGAGGPGNNVLSITVNGALCSAGTSAGYFNKPCVSVTVCTPGSTTACQTVNDILLDTGSYGLRIFAQALTVSLTPVTAGSGKLAECVNFADGTTDWGPVRLAKVILGNEPAVQVPIQVIDSTFATVPTQCANAETSPAAAGLNGILGVGLFSQDCGSQCASNVLNGVYFSCIGATCKGTAVALSDQVQNPAALLPVDNNGVIVQLPGVPAGGAPSINGNLVLGIGTQANNVAATSITKYNANQFGEIVTSFNGIDYPHSIIDSGSNGLFFTPPPSVLPNCAPPNGNWFCPASTVTLSAINTAATGSTIPIPFQIGNFVDLSRSSNAVFFEIGGAAPGLFDWGLPFNLGREVYVGFEGKSSSLGSGPYFAY